MADQFATIDDYIRRRQGHEVQLLKAVQDGGELRIEDGLP